MQRRKLPSLTPLRGLAALMVLGMHAAGHTYGSNGAIFGLAHGPLAVDFFFVLSGFVLAHVYGGVSNWTPRSIG